MNNEKVNEMYANTRSQCLVRSNVILVSCYRAFHLIKDFEREKEKYRVKEKEKERERERERE